MAETTTPSSAAPPPPDDPTRAKIADVHAALDAALREVRKITDARLPVPLIEQTLGIALAQVYGAMGAKGDWRRFRDKCTTALEQVRAALAHLMTTPSDDPSLNRVLGLVAGSIEKLQRVGFDLADDWVIPSRERGERIVWATLGVPRLIEIPRSVMRAAVPIDAPPVRIEEPPPDVIPAGPSTIEELMALADKAQKELAAFEAAQTDDDPPVDEAPKLPPALPPLSDAEAVRERFGVKISDFELLVERGKDSMNDLAMLGRMRRPSDEETWASGDRSENRMLRKIDAIVACGVDVFPDLVHMLDDRPLPDPELTFGNVFFLCCIAGDDTFDEATRLVELAELAEPGMLTMTTDAFVFAPHPRIDPFFARWLTHESSDRRALAAEVLRRRRLLSPAHIEVLGRDTDERVLASAVRALANVPMSSGLLAYALGHASEHVVCAALETAMLLRSRSGYERAVELVRADLGDFARAAMFVAIAGGREARQVLEDEIASEGHATAIRALGWYGDSTFVPFLLGRLEHGDEAVQLAALDSLERITGASLTDAFPEPEYDDNELPFVRARRDYAPVAPLSMDATLWRAWWKRYGTRAAAEHRYRWGQRWSPQDNLWELWNGDMWYRDRPFAAMELAVRSSRVDLDWEAWIIKQRAVLAQQAARPDTSIGWSTGLGR